MSERNLLIKELWAILIKAEQENERLRESLQEFEFKLVKRLNIDHPDHDDYEFTTRLNNLGKRGWSVVSFVDDKAIMQRVRRIKIENAPGHAELPY